MYELWITLSEVFDIHVIVHVTEFCELLNIKQVQKVHYSID